MTKNKKLNLQFFSEATLYELKQNMATVGQQLKKAENTLSEAAIDPSKSSEDIQSLQKSRDDLKMRFDVIKEQHDDLEAELKAKLESKKGLQSVNDPKQKVIEAKASLIRHTMQRKPVPSDVVAALGDNNDTGGEKFLPKTVSSDILTDPLEDNPLRQISVVSQITNLEIPRIAFKLDDDDFINDTETAKELEAVGDIVTFERHKFKVFAELSETVINGSVGNLVAVTENALQSGVAFKEKKVAFSTNPKTGEEHMSFYDTSSSNPVKVVTGADMYDAITNAAADLHEFYRGRATIVMSFLDYKNIIKTLANGNATLYTAQPQQVLGWPVVFCDSAIHPVVGDFSYSQFNYDLGALFDRDKDVKSGIESFVVTAWFDHQIKMKSAFRIASVDGGSGE